MSYPFGVPLISVPSGCTPDGYTGHPDIVFLPSRQHIIQSGSWPYRGPSCGYTGGGWAIGGTGDDYVAPLVSTESLFSPAQVARLGKVSLTTLNRSPGQTTILHDGGLLPVQQRLSDEERAHLLTLDSTSTANWSTCPPSPQPPSPCSVAPSRTCVEGTP